MNPPMFWTSVFIKGVRESKRLSECDLAKFLNVERHDIKAMERGGYIPRELVPKLNALCNLQVWDSKKLKVLRKRLGYTQAIISAMLAVHPDSYAAWESGKCNLPIEVFARLDNLSQSPVIIKWSGKELKKLRKKAGWTLTQAASYVDRDPSAWSRWERGLVEPPNKAALFEKLEEVLPKEWIEPLKK